MREKRSISTGVTDESETFSNDDQEGMELEDDEPLKCSGRITMNDMADLFELCKSKCLMKYFSVLV
jgi:hypothetical protein